MSLRERIDQRYFINTDDYDALKNDIESWNEGLSKLIFDDFSYLDEGYNKKEMGVLPAFYNLDEYKAFKKNIFNRVEQVKKIVELFLTRYKPIFEDVTSEEDSKAYWDDIEDGDWPKSSYNSFKEWYQSNGWYEWDNDNNQNNKEYFREENKDLFEILDSDDYIFKHSQEWIEPTAYDNKFQEIEKCIKLDLLGFDEQIDSYISANKYEAIIYCFN